MIHNLEVRLRRMEEIDYENMLEWRHDEEVMNFYSNPHDIYTIEKVVNKYKSRIDGKDKKIPCIIEYCGNPVGYIQFYELELAEKQQYELVLDTITYGMDVLIGDSRYRNKGIATQAIQLLQKYLFDNLKVQKIVLKLAKENLSANRCYEKCGFSKSRDINEKLILMEYSYPI
ncbi:aminoglycoside 6'-N-acetyltransferase [Paenibacillus sp. 1_12]|uniref:GNAT family N-acetyltransferase n=1 Tax=Paenibacillus sp. 1_12 TaxID=1566278 RepID=UPI0008EF7661|nr:GNAT family N-acetyltransferase [Paenibacillus sp. 1_12]SFM45865.1 aminoglycoside 6'-N-acetyltransferase [Paenibacillus sp. 1_12]